MRIGQSTDIHPLVPNRKLILGGVEIPYHLGCLGHSDADVLLHVIIEACIGAMGLGDIGTHFPDHDKAYKDISSMVLLKRCKELLDINEFEIVNIDSLILLEKPKLAPYIEQMKNNISSTLQIKPSEINVKATTSEKLGYIGREEGVQAQAVVLIKRKS